MPSGRRHPTTLAEVIRLASHAHHYLSVFDKHTGEPLYPVRARRAASPGQRIVLHAKAPRLHMHPNPRNQGWPPSKTQGGHRV
jgi:hypothetical protein